MGSCHWVEMPIIKRFDWCWDVVRTECFCHVWWITLRSSAVLTQNNSHSVCCNVFSFRLERTSMRCPQHFEKHSKKDSRRIHRAHQESFITPNIISAKDNFIIWWRMTYWKQKLMLLQGLDVPLRRTLAAIHSTNFCGSRSVSVWSWTSQG